MISEVVRKTAVSKREKSRFFSNDCEERADHGLCWPVSLAALSEESSAVDEVA